VQDMETYRNTQRTHATALMCFVFCAALRATSSRFFSALSAPLLATSICICRIGGGNSPHEEIDPWLMPMANPKFACVPKNAIACDFVMGVSIAYSICNSR